MAALSHADAIERLFIATLDALAEIDAFSEPSEPTSFVVYAHDADDPKHDDNLGPAHSDVVKKFIAWLCRLRTLTLSDQNPAGLFEHEPRVGSGESACRDILENQFCLLPRVGSRDEDEEATSISTAETVIVCGSPRLRSYCKHEFADGYLDGVMNVYEEYLAAGRPLDELRQKILEDVLVAATAEPGFHHALTELAFLELRHKYTPKSHGVVLVSFDNSTIDYLRFPQPTNLRLSVDVTSTGKALHDRFFKLLRVVYTQQHAAIREYEAAYKDGRSHIEDQHSSRLTGNDLAILFDRVHAKARRNLKNHENSEIRRLNQKRKLARLVTPANEHLAHKRDRILGTLPTMAYRAQKDRIPERVQGTCKWFTNHPRFAEWRSSESGGVLWLNAHPGCGKSVLLKYLVDTILVAPDTAVCYFFFKDEDEVQKSIDSALRCLLHQLFLQRPDIVTNEVLEKLEQDQQLLSSTGDLWRLLCDLGQSATGGSIVLVIDALDECHLEDQQVFLQLLAGWSARANSNTTRLKILVSSRPYSHIQRVLQGMAPKVHISAEDDAALEQISAEIDLVIAHKLDIMAIYLDLQQEQQHLLYRELTKVQQKTYLWAYLVLDEIDQMVDTTSKSIRETLQRLPQSVDEAYEQILNKARQQHRGEVMRLLSIIVAARRPLNLLQLAQAWTLTPEMTADDMEVVSEKQMRQMVKGFCGLFVMIVNRKVYLLHQTAREFLLAAPTTMARGGVLWKGSITSVEAELVMAQICLQYFHLCGCPPWAVDGITNKPVLVRDKAHRSCSCQHQDKSQQTDCFADYAIPQWAKHILAGQEVGGEELTRRAAQTCERLARVLFRYRNRQLSSPGDRLPPNHTMPVPPLTVAAIFGLVPVIKVLAGRPDAELEQREQAGMTALGWAVACQQTDAARALLALGTDYDAKDGQNEPLVSLAASGVKDGTEMLELLLDAGADPNARDGLGFTSLMEAARLGTVDSVVTLLRHGVDIEARDTGGQTALSIACEHGNTQTIYVLLEAGADPTKADKDGLTVLMICCASMRFRYLEEEEQNQQLEAILLLLRRARNVDMQDRHGDSALSMACQTGRQAVVRLLIEHGATVHERAVTYAVENGCTEVMQLLLDAGSLDIPGLDYIQHAALHTTARLGKVEMTRLLLRLGAVIDFPVHEGITSTRSSMENKSGVILDLDLRKETPLMVATRHARRGVVEVLLENGAVVDATDKEGTTPLMAATSQGLSDIMDLLLLSGADPEHVDTQGWTALALAARRRAADLVEILLCHGAQANNRDGNVVSSLSVAVSEASVGIVRLLLEQGADPTRPDHDQRSALELAAMYGHLDIVESMLPLIDDATALQTALDMAKKQRRTGLTEALGQRLAKVQKQALWDGLFLSSRLLKNTGGYSSPTLSTLGLRSKTHDWLQPRYIQDPAVEQEACEIDD